MQNPKYIEIAKTFERRIKQGDYAFSSLPGAHKLANEMGVSYMTARQAINQLVTNGTVNRLKTGRLQINEELTAVKGPAVALITPFWSFNEWHTGLQRAVKKVHGHLRIVAYAHNDDPIIAEALDGDFDIIFITIPFNSPPMLIERLKKISHKVIVLYHDFSEHGLYSLLGARQDKIQDMLKLLMDNGNKRIDCLNTQPFNIEVSIRVKEWQQFIDNNDVTGELHNHPVVSFESPNLPAYNVTKEILSGKEIPDAIFCTTVSLARGIYRACWEKDLTVGKDISICSFGEYDDSMMMTPALCTIASQEPTSTFVDIFTRLSKSEKLLDTLTYYTNKTEVFPGESIKTIK